MLHLLVYLVYLEHANGCEGPLDHLRIGNHLYELHMNINVLIEWRHRRSHIHGIGLAWIGQAFDKAEPVGDLDHDYWTSLLYNKFL